MKKGTFALVFWLMSFSMIASAQILNPVHWSYCVKPLANNEVELVMTAKIDKGFHIWSQDPGHPDLIPTSFTFKKADGIELIGKIREEGKLIKEDQSAIDLGIVKYYENQVSFIQKAKIQKAGKIEWSVEYQTCNHEGCLPPRVDDYSMSAADLCGGTGAANPAKTVDTAKDNTSETAMTNAIGGATDSFAHAMVTTTDGGAHIAQNTIDDKNKVYGKFGAALSECGDKQEELTLWKAFIFGILGGFAALFFPCTFPMIPMTISFFLKGAGDKRQGVKNGLLYGFFIFLVYFLLGLPFVLLGWGGDTLNNFATNSTVNIVYFVVFTFFAFSLFGFYDISLPSSLANKLDAKSNSTSFIGIFFMALTLAIVSFSCTGPILGLVLGNLKSTKYVLPAMSGFGIGLGAPFAVFAMFPNLLKALPKSGSWLDVLKNIFGFIELAFALKFLSNADLVMQWNVLKRELFMGIWIVIILLMAAYLMGWFAFKKSYMIKRSNATMALAAVTVAFAGYLAMDFFKGGSSYFGFPPPPFYSWGYKNEKHVKGAIAKTHELNGLQLYLNYDDALVEARKQNKPIMIDFTGWACVNCRQMEGNVWIKPAVYQLLKDKYVIASLYVDERIPLPAEKQYYSEALKKQVSTIGDRWTDMEIVNFQQVSQPFYALIDPRDERTLNHPRGNTPDVKTFEEFLKCGYETFKARKLRD